MVKTTKLIKQTNGAYTLEVLEELVSKIGWRNGHVLKIDTDNDRIIIDGHTGNITFEAMRWLSKHNINLTLLN